MPYRDAAIVRLPPRSPLVFRGIGMAALVANTLLKRLVGYRRPRPPSVDTIEASLRYDARVVDEWTECLEEYENGAGRGPFRYAGRRVIELGPGPDLGVGVMLLARGAARYAALDVNSLAAAMPASFYEAALARIAPWDADRRAVLAAEIDACRAGRGRRLRYVCDSAFDPSSALDEPVDLVVSQAAFEHFDRLPVLFERLAKVVAPGALFCAQVDLETHVHWLRQRDPLNIYRFGERTYRFWSYPGAPNRVRPHEYVSLLEVTGWRDVRVVPLKRLADDTVRAVAPSLAPRFREPEIGLLGVMILARRPDALTSRPATRTSG